MSRFEIVEIGDRVEPNAGLPEGCDLCGHCTMLRQVFGEDAALPCGGTRRPRALAAPSSTPATSASATGESPNNEH